MLVLRLTRSNYQNYKPSFEFIITFILADFTWNIIREMISSFPIRFDKSSLLNIFINHDEDKDPETFSLYCFF